MSEHEFNNNSKNNREIALNVTVGDRLIGSHIIFLDDDEKARGEINDLKIKFDSDREHSLEIFSTIPQAKDFKTVSITYLITGDIQIDITEIYDSKNRTTFPKAFKLG